MSPRRARSRRADPINALAKTLARVAGGPCVALQIRDTDGNPAMLLMGDSCPTCTAFRAQIPVREVPAPPAATTTTTPAPTSEEDIDLVNALARSGPHISVVDGVALLVTPHAPPPTTCCNPAGTGHRAGRQAARRR